MLKLASYILGENYKSLLKSSTNARQKIKVLFILLTLPALVWFISAYSASTVIFKTSSIVGFGVGLIAAIVVLIIDTSFMQSKQNGKVQWYRLSLVLCSCIIGSISIDMVLFHNDINSKMLEMQSINIDNAFEQTTLDESGVITSLISDIQTQEKVVNDRYHAYQLEMDGAGGTGRSGYGPIAREKKASWDVAKNDLDVLKSSKANKHNALMVLRNTFHSENSTNPGIIIHLQALWATAMESLAVKLMWLLLFVLTILIEYAPLFVKTNYGESDYDKWKLLDQKTKNLGLEHNRKRVDRLIDRHGKYSDADQQALSYLSKRGYATSY
jgi:hypothetical protein